MVSKKNVRCYTVKREFAHSRMALQQAGAVLSSSSAAASAGCVVPSSPSPPSCCLYCWLYFGLMHGVGDAEVCCCFGSDGDCNGDFLRYSR